MNKSVEIWTDGGCQGNPGPGAWAYVIRADSFLEEKSGFDPLTTNNRMELTAVLEALTVLAGSVDRKSHPMTVFTDSQYVQKGITVWIHSWERNSWRTSAKKPVKNADLWSALWNLARSLPVSWAWVEGHSGNEMNERCHHLVEQSIARGRPG